MQIKYALAAATLAFAGLAAMPGNAANTGSVAVLKQVGASQTSGIEKVHGWHRKCRRGLNGWHKHVPGVGRVQCTMAKNCYTNMFGVKVCDWF
jgi:hypothetical protein